MMQRNDTGAEALNRACHCSVVDVPGIRRRLDSVLGASPSVEHTHPHLFSEIPVFIAREHVTRMQGAIDAIETVARSEAWQRDVLALAPDIARRSRAASGVFFGYDFHIGADGPRLIEINTNAGGAFLNIAARDSQIACCEAGRDYLAELPDGARLEALVIDMFRREWRLARGDAPLRTIAIVDDDPSAQFLYPEFLLAQRLFETHGISTRIVDAAALRLADGHVAIDGEQIDLIYNRSTDFYFEAESSAVLRAAYESDLAVITPHPRAHALYANKRNLVWLSDAATLARLGIDREVIETLRRAIPVSREVRGDEVAWWNDRKGWFFKPESGFGSRGTYRGDKLTRRVFAELMNGDYIAQALTPAGERLHMKADVRCFAYEGRIQLMAARLYQGQTTNFRTVGGGFAPVYVTS
jgi:hypothetical protein